MSKFKIVPNFAAKTVTLFDENGSLLWARFFAWSGIIKRTIRLTNGKFISTTPNYRKARKALITWGESLKSDREAHAESEANLNIL